MDGLDETVQRRSAVYLEGDPNPVPTTLSVEAVAVLVDEMEEAGARFMRLPDSEGRDSLVRPQRVAAILPEKDDE